MRSSLIFPVDFPFSGKFPDTIPYRLPPPPYSLRVRDSPQRPPAEPPQSLQFSGLLHFWILRNSDWETGCPGQNCLFSPMAISPVTSGGLDSARSVSAGLSGRGVEMGFLSNEGTLTLKLAPVVGAGQKSGILFEPA
jgi:hypothetical protein